MASANVCDKPYSSADKWTSSFILGILFLLLSSPFAYAITKNIVPSIADSRGRPTLLGLVLHSILFVLIVRLMLNKDQTNGCLRPYTSKDKWTVSLLGGLLFALISSPFLYSVVSSLTASSGLDLSSQGCPNIGGLILHTAVFILITRLLIR